MSKTLCLNMIVKNESCIIFDTLKKLIDKIKFDYYIICDTGSTDDTVEIIKKFFNENELPGEIHQHTWKDFGYNRTLALQAAYKKTDYLLIFDADDYIHGNFVLPDLELDSYMLKFGNESNLYERMCLVKNDLPWKYIGVLHEYITCESRFSKGSILGDYYIVSGRTSSRNQDPQKYLKDAEILENGYHDSLKNGDGLHNRYSYYCANSYNDAGIKEKAIYWYKQTLTLNGWFEERYNSCLRLYELTQELDYLVESYHFNARRVEGIFLLIKHYTCLEMYTVAMNYYNFIKVYYENEYLTDNLNEKLFANVMDYTFYLPYYMIIVCERVKDYSTGLKMYEIIFEKMTTAGQWWTDNLLFNLQFYDYTQLKKLDDYLVFLESKNIKPNYSLTYLKNKQKKLNHFDLLIYTGFSKTLWNSTYSLNNALGGSERAVVYLANNFPKNWKIVISGDVRDEIIGNVHYINRFKIDDTYQFDNIIVSRYVSFFSIFGYLKCNNIILMAHDTHFMNNISGDKKTANEIISENRNKIKSIVYLTEWQRDHYTITHPECKSIPSVVINNGIEPELFPETTQKISNKFIYTSCSERGLKRLLELWEDIILNLPDATLTICSYQDFPKTQEDHEIKQLIEKYNIEHLGKLTSRQIYDLTSISEYWLYPCCFNETSCITALEMLMSRVVCLYYPIAGLTDTIKDHGIPIEPGNEIESLLNLTVKRKMELRNRGRIYATDCSWKNRSKQWESLIKCRRIVFYAKPIFAKEMLEGYVDTIGAVYTTDPQDLLPDDLILFVHEVFDETVNFKFKNVGYFNTEPLNLQPRRSYVLQVVEKYHLTVYDYSKSNIKILNQHGITDTVFLEYRYHQPEVDFLIEERKKYPIFLYDFGIICSSSVWTTDINSLQPPRRKRVVETLIKNGFRVNIIKGFGRDRDIELAKCRTILNIHGQFREMESTIFEHIRCNRLLYAGYDILSEESENMDPEFIFENLKFIKYNDFFKLKKTKFIVDAFTFYNELDMLTYRLDTLYDSVDYFILVEATLTHVGRPKELYYQNNKSLFEKFNDKIIHIVVDDFPYSQENLNISKGEQWINEKFQRNCITRGFSKIDGSIDILLLSDVDEIPNPETLKLIATGKITIETCMQFEQDFYYYNIESKMDHLWYFSKIVNVEWFLTTDLKLDDLRMNNWPTIREGGWHLSYFGNPEFISNKIKNFAHQEFNNNIFTDTSLIASRINNGIDVYDRNIKIIKIDIKENKSIPPNYNNTYCFIHSCNGGDVTRLNYLIDRLKTSGINFKKIVITNIGIPIYNEFLEIENYSEKFDLFEIPTINRIAEFSKQNPYDNVLYLHTKGVSYKQDYQEVNDWIDLMLYFLLNNDNKKLLNSYDCIGCNYKQQPKPHFSGNFWWANCKYLSRLGLIENFNKMDAEFWLMQNKPDYFSLHNSDVDHYRQRYPREIYVSKSLVDC